MDAKQALREYQKQYYQTHSEHLRQYQKNYTKTHRDEIRKKHRINYRLRKMELLNATSERSKNPLRKPLRSKQSPTTNVESVVIFMSLPKETVSLR
jgi:hypothetical protein